MKIGNDEGRQVITLSGASEYVYCPRLFYLRDVAKEDGENHHLLEGLELHRAVDKPGGVLDSPDENEEETWHSRSLWLSDEDLGLSGILDFVDVEEGDELKVMPVDTKKGKPRSDGTMWPTDRTQVTLQALLLRKKGYHVERIAIYYASIRRRVVEELNAPMIAAALEEVEGARRVMALKQAPPPLVDSPKCPGCSLNSICLPDEYNALIGKSEKVRQVLVPKHDAQPMYVTLAGTRLGLVQREIVVTPPVNSGEKVQRFSIGKISEINLYGGVQITTQTIHACLQRSIPIRFFSYGGWYFGRATGFSSRNVAVRQAQFAKVQGGETLGIARVLVADKIHNSRVLLLRNSENEHDVLASLRRTRNTALKQKEVSKLLGTEGEAAKLYWGAFSRMCARHDEGFEMKGRNRRPPKDATNALLSFAYALLVKDCVRAVESAGLDPHLGVYHTAHHGRPSLALDLMEPFRPLIADSVVFQLIRRNEAKPEHFTYTGENVTMKKSVKKALIRGYERRMQAEVTHPLFGYKASYRRVLAIQARLLARTLTGELTTYPSFRTR